MKELEKNILIENLKKQENQSQALFRQNFAKRLKEIRLKKGLTQKEVAKQLNLRVSTYANWEQGTREPSCYYILILSIIFAIDVNELFYNLI